MNEKKMQLKKDRIPFAKRIEEIRKWKRLSKSEFSEILGYSSETSYNPIVSGNKMFPSEKMFKLASTFPDLNLNWLFRGKGEMLLTEGEMIDIEKMEAENKALKDKILKMEGMKEAYEKVIEDFRMKK